MSNGVQPSRFILVGKPNVGKSTLFNALTHSDAATGNRSGVTVDKKSAFLNNRDKTQIIDLPGIDFFDYNCEDHPIDQQITINQIKNMSKNDIIINVIDSNKLLSQLYLTLELIETGHKIALIINSGTSGQKKALSRTLGITVLTDKDTKDPRFADKLISQTKKSTMTNIVKDFRKNISPDQCEDYVVAYRRHSFIDQLNLQHVTEYNRVSQALDTIALNKYIGLPLFFTTMFATFWVTIVLGSVISPILESLTAFITHSLFTFSHETILELPLASLSFALVTLSSFIAPLALLYFMLGLLEESGYMQRAACVIDKVMRALNLPGQSFIPIIVGFGCNVPAIMSSRTINFEHDRIQTILMSPFMSCSARLAIFTVFASSFFGSHGTGHSIIFLLYILGFFIAIFTGFVIRHVLDTGHTSCLIQEVSPYKVPNMSKVMLNSYKKIKRFIEKASIVIIPFTLFIHLSLCYLPGFIEVSMSPLAWLFNPMGLGTDQAPAILSLFAGILAKEVVIGALEAFHFNSSWLAIDPALYQEELLDALAQAYEKIYSLSGGGLLLAGLDLGTPSGYLHEIFPSQHAAISYMIFVLLYFPCLSVTATIAKESHRLWAIFSSIWSTVIAYICAVLYYQLFTPDFSYIRYFSYLALSFLSIMVMIYWLKFQIKKIRSPQIPMKLKTSP